MNIVLCEDKCPNCGNNLVKMPDCGGDYYETINGFQLQRYCVTPGCNKHGHLIPILDGVDPNFISNTSKNRIATKLAFIYRKGFKEFKQIAKNIAVNDKILFVREFSTQTGIAPEVILEMCS